MHEILNLVVQYGYIIIYLLLTIELMGVPFLPGELLITYCGFLVFQGKLNFLLVVITAALGVITGLTASYFIGRKLGEPFFYKYGPKIHLSHEKMDKLSEKLNKYGVALMLVVCFIPGVKHVIGYFSGTSSMKFKKYAFSCYTGAFIWAIAFTFIGNALGSEWNNFHKYITKYLLVGGSILVAALVIFYIIKIYRKQILDFIINVVVFLIDILHSLGRLRAFIIITTIVCLGFIDIFINIIQGLLSSDFTPFNEITNYMIGYVFNNSIIFRYIFKAVNFLTIDFAYLAIGILLIGFTYYKSKERTLEIKYILITFIGGFLLKDLVIYIFKEISLKSNLFGSFLNGPSFTVIVIYGFATYLSLGYLKKKYQQKILVVFFILISGITAIAQLYFGSDLSDILAAYSLAIVWLTLNIILLEIMRVVPNLRRK